MKIKKEFLKMPLLALEIIALLGIITGALLLVSQIASIIIYITNK